jgi:hypothetical protein
MDANARDHLGTLRGIISVCVRVITGIRMYRRQQKDRCADKTKDPPHVFSSAEVNHTSSNAKYACGESSDIPYEEHYHTNTLPAPRPVRNGRACSLAHALIEWRV